ncbi:hypothetical protein VTJ04DRAFT_5119 [Mycothermus thermophilus]|uniref:uncharacterized protein n=1 Tax=Humicola insolens TaxID=85995 RepID=UPI00374208D6
MLMPQQNAGRASGLEWTEVGQQRWVGWLYWEPNSGFITDQVGMKDVAPAIIALTPCFLRITSLIKSTSG